MNKFRKLSALLMMVFTLGFLTFLPIGENVLTVDAATEVKINKDKLTLYVDGSYTLKISGTTKPVKWSTTNKRVVKVSSKGKVTALDLGTATVTATVNKKEYKCKVTVKGKMSVDEKSIKVTDINGYVIFNLKDRTEDDYVTFEVSDPTILACYWEEWDGNDITLHMIPLNDGATTVNVTLNENSQEKIQIKVECSAGSIDKKLKKGDALAAFAKLLAPCTFYYPDSVVINDIYYGTLTENSVSKECVILDISAENGNGDIGKGYEIFYFGNEAYTDRESIYSSEYNTYVNYDYDDYFPVNFKTEEMKNLFDNCVYANYFEAKGNYKINLPTIKQD